jgi:alkylation response protein AidB-like acyl-CoA dehydrogenase
MDFDLSEEQAAISDLAAQILTDRLGPERLAELDADPEWFARDVWADLARADLLGISLPEADGGGGYGLFEACLVLEQIGRAVAPLPYLATIVLGALPVAEFGSDRQRAALLPGVIAGETVLTAGLVEAGSSLVPAVPATVARREGSGWQLHGEKLFVPAAHLATRVLVPARTSDAGEVGVFLVDPSAPGVALERLVTTSGEPQFRLTLDQVVVGVEDVLGAADGGTAVVDWITDRAIVGLCAVQAGVCEAAVHMTATYTSERKQFDSPIATFQAVAHRAADAFIDATGVRYTTWLAAWRVSEGLPAADEIDVAKFWAADGGQRVVHAAQHLHGGIGVDKDYPLHRYFLWAKTLELTLGGATEHLRSLGARLADASAGAS